MPPVVASLSFVAAEISALTIVGFPANAYGENWEYVPFFLGGAVAASLSPFSSSPSTIDATDPDFDACDGDSAVLSLSGDWHAPLCLLPAAPPEAKAELPHFVAFSLPVGLKGLMLTAIILASIDSPLSSLCSSFVTDIYRPLIRRRASERHYLLVSRVGIVAFGVVLALIAWSCQSIENVLWFAFQMFSVTGGAMLGIFLLGMLTQRRANRGNVVAMVARTMPTIGLLLLSKWEIIPLAWSWVIVVGTGTTFLMAYVLGSAQPRAGGVSVDPSPQHDRQ